MPKAPRKRPGKHADPSERRRPSAHKRGYDSNWRAFAKWYLKANPLCVAHLRRGRVVRATCVDHIVPHKGDPALFNDPANVQGLCDSCHGFKTAKEDGGFGRPIRLKVNDQEL